jgi:hypothetical protein
MFLQWKARQTKEIYFGSVRKLVNRKSWQTQWRSREVPIPYARIIHQLYLESKHADSNQGHEAQRRQSYALRVLDKLGEELDKAAKPGPQWRSKVLTPILQRQLQGVPDAYSPAIESSICAVDEDGEEADVTISDATQFYLDTDPVDPSQIPCYRRNMIYIREMRWHLSILMRTAKVEDIGWFNVSLHNQDVILNSKELPSEGGDGGIPPFSQPDVGLIVSSFLEEYFKDELKACVSISIYISLRPFTHLPYSRIFWRKPWRKERLGSTKPTSALNLPRQFPNWFRLESLNLQAKGTDQAMRSNRNFD